MTDIRLLGVDTGGTFTDFVLFEQGGIRIHKVLSTPSNPALAILQGINELFQQNIPGDLVVIHGSTVATNAALERKGVRTVYVANKGFKDVLSIGRQARRELYNLTPPAEELPVPRELCVEVDCRRDADGEVVTSLSKKECERLVSQIKGLQPESVAINLLFSYKNAEEEIQLEQLLQEHYFVSRSSYVLPEYKEYERGIATWLNAWLGPIVEKYLLHLADQLPGVPVSIMQSSGGTISLPQASRQAVNLLLSGPAGGLAAARFIGKAVGHPKILTFDMGGTSTDVALIDGDIKLTNEGKIGPYPVAVPMVDMHTIGAGGGSIAWIDEGGMLQVGPQSAGADPGPACYGRGGTEATVTDANLVLGRIDPGLFLGGEMALDADASSRAIKKVADTLRMSVLEAAEGIIKLANEHMTRALRTISVQKGYNPADFVLYSFGGAGGLHVCALADALEMRSAVVPANSGVLSALGMVVAPKERRLTKTLSTPLMSLDVNYLMTEIDQLIRQGENALLADGVNKAAINRVVTLDLCYQGQSFTLEVGVPAWQDINVEALENISGQFHRLHQRRYGHAMPLAIELVNIRVSVYTEGALKTLPKEMENSAKLKGSTGGALPVLAREQLKTGDEYPGPVLVVDAVSTTFVGENWSVCKDNFSNLLLKR